MNANQKIQLQLAISECGFTESQASRAFEMFSKGTIAENLEQVRWLVDHGSRPMRPKYQMLLIKLTAMRLTEGDA